MSGPRRWFGTDGIRGRVGQGPISADFVLRLGNALGRVLAAQQPGRRSVVIGKDTRISGYMFEAALEAGLVAAGVDVQMLGPMPTPAVAFLTRTLGADAGIVISASHNPHHDNGIKFFSAEGEKLDDATELAIEAALDGEFSTVESERLGKAVRGRDAVGRYIEFCKASVPRDFDLRGLKVVLDCAHGATYHIAPLLFSELGAQVTAIGAAPDGLNINAGVGSMHLDGLAARVRETGADLGIAFDGDGDRVLMVDDQGTPVDGDGLLYVLARDWQAGGRLRGPVVGTLMTNYGLEQALAAAGIAFQRARVATPCTRALPSPCSCRAKRWARSAAVKLGVSMAGILAAAAGRAGPPAPARGRARDRTPGRRAALNAGRAGPAPPRCHPGTGVRSGRRAPRHAGAACGRPGSSAPARRRRPCRG